MFRNFTKMHLFLCYDLSKRYSENFFGTTDNQNCLFVSILRKIWKNVLYIALYWNVQALIFLTIYTSQSVSLRGYRRNFKWPSIFGVACPVGLVNIGIEPTAHWKSLRFHRKGTKKNYFLFSCFTSFSWKFNAKLKSEKRLKKLKIEWVRAKISSKTLKSLKTGI